MQVALREAIERAQESTGKVEYEVLPMTDDTLIRTGIPERFQRVEPNTTYATHLIQRKNLYICGRVGVGKTHLTCAILRAWVEAGNFGRFISSLHLLDELKNTFSSNQANESDVIERYGKTPLLVVDDLGKECPTEWALSKLYDVIDTRYNETKPTIITTQFTPDRLVMHLARGGNSETAEAIVSRLLMRAEVIQLAGKDRRR